MYSRSVNRTEKMRTSSHIWVEVLLIAVLELQYTSATITKLSPQYVAVDEGTDSIVFTCVSNLSPTEAILEHWMEWKKNIVPIIKHDTVLVDVAKYSVQGASNISSIIVVQNLTVHNIEETDSGIISCTLESTSEHVTKSSSYAELTVSHLKKTTEEMNVMKSSSYAELTEEMQGTIQSKDNTKIIIYLTAGGILFVITFFGCLLIMCKIKPNNSSSDNNNDCHDNGHDNDQDKERRMSFYCNIDANIIGTEMTEKTVPSSTDQNDFNI